MKLSDKTRNTVDLYIDTLVGIASKDFPDAIIKPKHFSALRTLLYNDLHQRERFECMIELADKAMELGYILTKMEKK